jgi:hypothetical protein
MIGLSVTSDKDKDATETSASNYPGGEAGHSLPFNAQGKNGGAIPPLPHTSSWRGA